jgi:hypothetical protein
MKSARSRWKRIGYLLALAYGFESELKEEEVLVDPAFLCP